MWNAHLWRFPSSRDPRTGKYRTLLLVGDGTSSVLMCTLSFDIILSSRITVAPADHVLLTCFPLPRLMLRRCISNNMGRLVDVCLHRRYCQVCESLTKICKEEQKYVLVLPDGTIELASQKRRIRSFCRKRTDCVGNFAEAQQAF